MNDDRYSDWLIIMRGQTTEHLVEGVASLEDTIARYRADGFEVTHETRRRLEAARAVLTERGVT